MDLGLTDRVAFVTGGSGGIGAAVCQRLAAEGARVAIGFQSSREHALRLVEEIAAAGGTAMAVEHDLADGTSPSRSVETITGAWSRLDVLVTCAWKSAGWPSPDREDTDLAGAESWREQLGLNVEGTAAVVQAVVGPMKQSGWGRIVMISSGAAEEGQPGLESYAAAKAALHAFNRSLARGLGRAGILSNVVMPGFVKTERNARFIPQVAFDQWASTTPTGRLPTCEEVATVVGFLASGANGSTTGTAIRVTGGA